MRNLFTTLFLAFGFALLMGSLAFAQDKSEKAAEKKEVQITGEIVDLGCFIARDARGDDHKSCATRCLTGGNPAGLVTADGKVFTIAATAPAYADFASTTVRLSGSIKESIIKPSKMEVKDGDKWKEVEMSKSGAPKKE